MNSLRVVLAPHEMSPIGLSGLWSLEPLGWLQCVWVPLFGRIGDETPAACIGVLCHAEAICVPFTPREMASVRSWGRMLLTSGRRTRTCR